jgi:hypothetical protein
MRDQQDDDRGTVERVMDALLATFIGAMLALALAFWWSV